MSFASREGRFVLMGVAGCGKSSVGTALAVRLGAVYLDGDDLHPPENIEKMSRGEPLTDDNRWPWLTHVGQTLALQIGICIVGWSSLNRRYRDLIRAQAAGPVVFVHLCGSRALIAGRMAPRVGHFMPTSLLDSQFAALKPPGPEEDVITVDIDKPLERLVGDIVTKLEEQSS